LEDLWVLGPELLCEVGIAGLGWDYGVERDQEEPPSDGLIHVP
jgi:hypothetical protein